MKHKIQPVGQGRQARLDRFMRNKNIFVLDYKKMKERNEALYLDLVKYIMHPNRVEKMALSYNMEFFEYLESIE